MQQYCTSVVPFHMASSTAPHSEKQGEQQEKRIQRKAQKHEMGNTKMAIKPHSRMQQRGLASFHQWCRKVVCVGRNYAEHAKELGNAVPQTPVLFLKPPSSLVTHGSPVELPAAAADDSHHEVELGLVIGKRGRDIPEAAAMDHIGGYALAIDMTARGLQNEAKNKGLPWSVAKGYDTFCPVSRFIAKEELPHPEATTLWLKVDDELRQNGSTKDMIFSIPFLVSHISSIMTLEEGDLILTGTPSGVGPVKPGQRLTAGIEGISLDMSFPVLLRSRPSA